MKYSILFIFLTVSLVSGVESLLSPQKQEILRIQKEKDEAEYEKLKYEWVSPLNLNAAYGYDKKNQAYGDSTTKSISASISQDIFRSGGITYQLAYADAKKQSNAISLQKQISEYNQQLFIALLNYRKNRVMLEQSQKRLENKEIEIFIKRQLFDIGKADITELNRAFMDKSSEEKNIASIRYTLLEQRLEIAKISDLDPETYLIGIFELIPQKTYIEHQLNLEYARAQSKTLQNLYEVTASRYLPSIAINANIGYTDYNTDIASAQYETEHYGGGVQLTMPFTYNASATTQEARAAHLIEIAKTADLEREAEAHYAQIIHKIDNYRQYIALTTHNLPLYDALIRALQAGVDAGTKTGYDLQTLKNTKTVEELEIAINEINIQIELAKLYFALNTPKDN